MRSKNTLTTLVVLLILCGCSVATPATPTPTPLPPTDTPQPTPTLPPLAAMVNGEAVFLSEYQASLTQLQAADTELGLTETADEQKQRVLDDLINQTLLAQAAAAAGFTVDDATLQQRIDDLTSQMGGADAFNAWLSQNGYTPDSFRSALRRSIAAAWQRDQLLAQLNGKAEQVHARQILVRDQDRANGYYEQLQAGVDFATIIKQVDPITGGELGWFPRGYLTNQTIEDAVFALEVGQYTQVIESEFGYHIIQVMEKDPARTLSADALRVVGENLVQSWLDAQRASATVQILVP